MIVGLAAARHKIPAFVFKLFSLVSNASAQEFIRWAPTGESFVVLGSSDLAAQILPQFFKHNNFTSFLRQLNMYGFYKLHSLTHGSMNDDGLLEFKNNFFQKDRPDLLVFVVRKKFAFLTEGTKQISQQNPSMLTKSSQKSLKLNNSS